MINLKHRSSKKELLDSNDIPFAGIKQTMKELNRVNTLLGGHKISIEGIKKIINLSPGTLSASLQDYEGKKNEILICEIGCGGGDNLNAISKWINNKINGVRFIGIDIKKECTEFAKEHYPELPATWVTSDFFKVDFGENKPDIIFSSLLCHHFSDEELIIMLKWMQIHSRQGFFINDLQRHPLAYFLIKGLTKLFSKSYLVKYDAPLSVARGFKKKEWEIILKGAGIINYTIKWQWAFRYLITVPSEYRPSAVVGEFPKVIKGVNIQ